MTNGDSSLRRLPDGYDYYRLAQARRLRERASYLQRVYRFFRKWRLGFLVVWATYVARQLLQFSLGMGSIGLGIVFFCCLPALVESIHSMIKVEADILLQKAARLEAEHQSLHPTAASPRGTGGE